MKTPEAIHASRIAIQETQDESPYGGLYFFPSSIEEFKRLKLLGSQT